MSKAVLKVGTTDSIRLAVHELGAQATAKPIKEWMKAQGHKIPTDASINSTLTKVKAAAKDGTLAAMVEAIKKGEKVPRAERGSNGKPAKQDKRTAFDPSSYDSIDQSIAELQRLATELGGDLAIVRKTLEVARSIKQPEALLSTLDGYEKLQQTFGTKTKAK